LKHADNDNSIDDVDEDKIDEILRDASRNLVIFFYDGKQQCPSCGDALSEVEEIDDDIEATGYVQVVKTDDRSVARDLGIVTFPSLVYYRRKNPILYDGGFKDSEEVLRWLRSHEEVVTWDLTDDNFEARTDSHSPDEGTLDWFLYRNLEGAPLEKRNKRRQRGLVLVGNCSKGTLIVWFRTCSPHRSPLMHTFSSPIPVSFAVLERAPPASPFVPVACRVLQWILLALWTRRASYRLFRAFRGWWAS
uniref:Thioredoxin domain-containing protein n=1 Tax=Heligmosomoides polygyrus TaxID=6339 RepID=A0A183FM72_HELPZ